MGPDSFILPGDMQLRVYISVLLVQQDRAVTIIAKCGNIVFHGWMVPMAKSSKLKTCNADTVHPCICFFEGMVSDQGVQEGGAV